MVPQSYLPAPKPNIVFFKNLNPLYFSLDIQHPLVNQPDIKLLLSPLTVSYGLLVMISESMGKQNHTMARPKSAPLMNRIHELKEPIASPA